MGTIPRKRRRTRLKERIKPCECCGHVISQRHHLLPVARYGENNLTAHLCANCHEAYHIFERGYLDFAAHRYESHAMYLMGAIRWAWGGADDPRVKYLCDLWEYSQKQQQNEARAGYDPEFQATRARLLRLLEMKEEAPDVRRGDIVRLKDGRVLQVVSVRGDCFHTPEGIYSIWDIERIAKW
jgi:hypothetical protein